MGISLVVYNIEEEALGWPQLQREIRRRAQVEQEGSSASSGSPPARELAPHPSPRPRPKPSRPDYRQQAMDELGIPKGGIWEPPPEPSDLEWWREPELRRRHAEAVRRSLEEFLNGHLASLYHMVRTGWWVLGKVRVRVVECHPVPEREMRAKLRGFEALKKEGKRARTRAGSKRARSKRK